MVKRQIKYKSNYNYKVTTKTSQYRSTKERLSKKQQLIQDERIKLATIFDKRTNERTIVENKENVEFTIYQIITLNFRETDRQMDRSIDETKRNSTRP